MPIAKVSVSKFDEPEPGAVSRVWAGCRDARCSLSSSKPSFCFQPVPPSLRLGWFRGLAPCGLVLVLAATLAACCAALTLADFSGDGVLGRLRRFLDVRGWVRRERVGT